MRPVRSDLAITVVSASGWREAIRSAIALASARIRANSQTGSIGRTTWSPLLPVDLT